MTTHVAARRDEARFAARTFAWLGAFCATGSSAAAAETAAAPSVTAPLRGDPAAGADKALAERCLECHSSDPRRSGPDDGTGAQFARLAGQDANYLQKQLMDFRSGRRRHDFMEMMARSLDDADAADIVAYYAALPPMHGDGSGSDESARRLFDSGDPARGITACTHCHGAVRTPGVPRLAGQDVRYLQQQLAAWRNGERRNAPDGAMNAVTAALTDAEIRQLAGHLAGQ